MLVKFYFQLSSIGILRNIIAVIFNFSYDEKKDKKLIDKFNYKKVNFKVKDGNINVTVDISQSFKVIDVKEF